MILWSAVPALAQSQLPGQLDSADKLLGGDEQQFDLSADTGLAGTDIRKTIGQVINVILGLLGVVALGFVLYGGFLWMTAAGNDDQIETAKKLLLNATIGLVVILSAFAITSFVISRLIGATGEGSDGDGGVVDDDTGTLPSDMFTVKNIQPQGQQKFQDLKVLIEFTQAVDAESVTDANVQVLKNETDPVVGTFSYRGPAKLVFTPTGACPEPDEGNDCFERLTPYLVRVLPGKGLKSAGAAPKDLVCVLLGSKCKVNFISGDGVDVEKPEVSITSPTGGFVKENAKVPISFRATDDGGISMVDVSVDGSSKGTAAPDGDTPLEFTGAVTWDTPAYTPNNSYVLRATAYDVDDHTGESPKVRVSLRPFWCFNDEWDEDKGETDIDCGGTSECGACDGGPCENDSDCKSGVCQDTGNGKVCVSPPVITRVAPTETSPGGIITVEGKNFGSTQGVVTMLGDTTKTTDDEDGVAPPQQCGGAIVWTDTRIVFAAGVAGAAEDGFQTGPVRVKTSTNLETDTSGTSKSVKVDVRRALKNKPGICKVEPPAAAPGETIIVKGFGLGPTSAPAPTVTISEKPTAAPTSWGAAFVEGIVVPSLSPGVADIIVKPSGGVDSNPLAFEVLETPDKPILQEISPSTGPLGTYVTLRGSNFGSVVGFVRFLDADATTFEEGEPADLTFPRACSAGTWTPSEVLVKVPQKLTAQQTPYRIVMKVGNALSNEKEFTVTPGTARPGICLLDPNNGPLGLPLTVYGERLGASEGSIEFYDAQESPASKQLASVEPGGWETEKVKAAVPFQSTPGPAHVKARRASTQTGGLQVGGDPSNSLLFTIQNCLDEKKPSESCAAVTPGTKCCSDGACRTQCVPSGKQCQYEWSFTTDTGPTVDPKKKKECKKDLECGGSGCKDGYCAIPFVVERKSCDKDVQSPSPYKNTENACPNAKIVVQFSEEMKDSTLVNRDNFEVFRCKAGTTDDCTTRVDLAPWDETAITEHKTLQLTPTATLAYDTWYLVRIRSDATAKEGVRSEEFGVLLDGNRDNVPGDPYEWLFKTAGTNCTADAARVVPKEATINSPAESQAFTGIAFKVKDQNCNVINYTGSWDWKSSKPLVASIGPSTTAKAVAWPKKETDKDDPVLITATPIVDPAIVDGNLKPAKLTIVYESPRILEAWPNCTAACTNVEIGARFSAPINSTTLTAKDKITGKYTNVLFYRCPPTDVRLGATGLMLKAVVSSLESTGAETNSSATALADKISGETTPEISQVSDEIKSLVTTAITAGKAAKKTVDNLAVTIDAVVKGYDEEKPPVSLDNLKAYIGDERVKTTSLISAANLKSAPATLADASEVSVKMKDLGEAVTNLATYVATYVATNATTFNLAVQCTNENQIGPIPISSIGYNTLSKTMRFYAPATDPLQPSTLYRVLIKGGPGGVLGEDTNKDLAIDKSRGVTLEEDTNKVPYAAWMFATKEAPATCALASVELAPKELIVNAVDEKSPYASTARGSPDPCNKQGQRIDPFAYDWTWESPNRESSFGKQSVATFEPFATHVYGGSTYRSPDQKATSLAEGFALMRAGSAGKEDEGIYEVKCGYTSNAQCVNANGGDTRYGLMSGSSCCSIRPTVTTTTPADKATGVCRNTAISLRFSKKMDEKTFTGNILLQKKIEDGKRVTIGTTLTTTHGVEESTVAIAPLGMLEGNKVYAVVVEGEQWAADATKTVRSAAGVSMAEDYEFTFETGGVICQIKSVAIQVYDARNAELDTPKSEWEARQADFFGCAGRNDCPGDTERNSSGNQHWYRAVPYDKVESDTGKKELTAKSTLWDVVSGIDVVTLPATPTPAQSRTSVTSTAKNGVATVQAVVSGTPEEGSGTKTIDITAFICENPWPSLDKFPWEDAAASLKWTGTTPYTNMQFYYCRDAGKPGTQDDLPALRTPVKVPEQSAAQSVIKEYLLPVCPAGEANCDL